MCSDACEPLSTRGTEPAAPRGVRLRGCSTEARTKSLKVAQYSDHVELDIIEKAVMTRPYAFAEPAGDANLWLDERLLPVYVAALSLLVLVVGRCFTAAQLAQQDPQPAEDGKGPLAHHGGLMIVALKSLKLAAVLGLLVLSVAQGSSVQKIAWLHYASVGSLGYMLFLALMNVLRPAWDARVYSRHLTLNGFTLFCVFAYRDIWPLMTFTLRPLDEGEGPVLWAKIALAAFVGVVEPLFEPYPRVSPDATNAEQTASIFSFLLYLFLDPMVWKAYRVPHLPHDALPSLPERDQVKDLIQRNFKWLDPFCGAMKRSPFFGLVAIFRTQLMSSVLILTVQAAAKLAAPVGVNRLLTYLENKRKGYGAGPVVVRPWVWILWIAIGPMIDTVLSQLYQYLTSVVVVRTEAIITALVFDHSLRIRLKAEVDKEKDRDGADEKSAKRNLVGKINNLVTGDLDTIAQGKDFLSLVVSVPAQVFLSTWFLYTLLGWSVFVGMAVMVILAPVPAKFAALIGGAMGKKMKATDARVQTVTEVMNVLKMIKLFGWQKLAKNEIEEKRQIELRLLWKARMLNYIDFFVNHTIPLVHMIVTYLIYILVMKQDLTASVVFSSVTTFNMLRNLLFRVLDTIPILVTAKVSLGRLADFLWNTELLDAFDEKPVSDSTVSDAHAEDIGFGSARFYWSKREPGAAEHDSDFCLQIHEDVVFRRGALNLIVGPTGSGKTSVLMALLNEMHYQPLGSESWVNLSRSGGVAYVAQKSWVQNATIKENILMGQPYDKTRYTKVLHQCALNQDLRLLSAGDETEVGERGLTLSGGQKARITLARAIYSKAEILLLDDILAALDVHTARWIVTKCLTADLVEGRTVLLITHNIGLTRSIAQFAVSLGLDGTIVKRGTPAEVFANDPSLAEEIRHEEEALEMDEHEDETMKPSEAAKEGGLIVAEEIAIGRVSWQAVKMFFIALGGDWPLLFWSQSLLGLAMSEFFDVVEIWWLGRWAHQYDLLPHDAVRVGFYLSMYCAIIASVIVWSVWGTIWYVRGSQRASYTINKRLVSSLLGSTFRWLDVTPVSRVITRCTQDILAVDTSIQGYMRIFLIVTFNMLIKFTAVIVYTPVFMVPAIVTAALGVWFGHMYVRAQMSVKRELSNAKSPVLGMFGSAMEGLVSIRAYQAQQFFRTELLSRIDHYTRANRAFNNLQRWIAVRIDMLSAMFSSAVAFYLVYSGYSTDPASIGFILTVAVTFTEMVLWCVNMYNSFEVNANSLERIHQYLYIEQEPSSGVTPPAYWPSSGSLQVEKLTARYSVDGPDILHGLTFSINTGERIGIVGRTGSGKSTLTLALLRCIPTEGLVVFDGIPTHTVTLDALRSSVTIIPQMPELMSGTLRHNLDPFGQYDDAILNDALRASGWFASGGETGEQRLSLDSMIAERGGNLSVGQRQIIALARAIVRRSKLLILDEATSAIDYETDAIIQRSLRNELTDVTVITVAHRLQTIMDYDKIMVLDAGHLVEFDTPKALLEKKDTLLYALVEQSADKEALYAMAGARM